MDAPAQARNERLVHVTVPPWQVPMFFMPLDSRQQNIHPAYMPPAPARATTIVPGQTADAETEAELAQQGLRPLSEVAVQQRSVFTVGAFNKMQSAAFDDVYKSDKNIVLVAPTGSGKTVLMTLAILRAMLNDQDNRGRFVYIAPYKELCEERASEWRRDFMKMRQDVVFFTGDSSAAEKRHALAARIIVTTPEKWEFITGKHQRDEWKEVLTNVRLLMIDECHLLGDPRGRALEVLMSRTRVLFTNLAVQPRIMAVSATIPNPGDLQKWITHEADYDDDPISDTLVLAFGSEYRATRLTKLVYTIPDRENDNIWRCDARASYAVPDIVLAHARGQPSMILCNTRRSAEEMAERMYCNFESEESFKDRLAANGPRKLKSTAGYEFSAAAQGDGSPYDDDDHQEEAEGEAVAVQAQHRAFDFSLNFPTWAKPDADDLTRVQDSLLKTLLPAGIAFHHADLLPADRAIVTSLVRQHKVAVTCATSTLTTGINLPFKLVLLKIPVTWTPDGQVIDLPLRQIFQAAGRPGRPGFFDEGIAIVLTTAMKRAEYEERFVRADGPTEALESRMAQYTVPLFLRDCHLGFVETLLDAREWEERLFESEAQRNQGLQKWADCEGIGSAPAPDFKRDFPHAWSFGLFTSPSKFRFLLSFCLHQELVIVDDQSLKIQPSALGIAVARYEILPFELATFRLWAEEEWDIEYLTEIILSTCATINSDEQGKLVTYIAEAGEGVPTKDYPDKNAVDQFIWLLAFAVYFAATHGCPDEVLDLLVTFLASLACTRDCYRCGMARKVLAQIKRENADVNTDDPGTPPQNSSGSSSHSESPPSSPKRQKTNTGSYLPPRGASIQPATGRLPSPEL